MEKLTAELEERHLHIMFLKTHYNRNETPQDEIMISFKNSDKMDINGGSQYIPDDEISNSVKNYIFR